MILRRQSISGVKSVGLSTFVVGGLQAFQLVVLTRLLQPSDFGVMGMAMLVINFLVLFSDLGTGNALIHKGEVPEDHVSSLFWLSLFTGAVLGAATWILAPLLASMFSERRLTEVFYWATLMLIIAPIGQQYQCLLEKWLEFRLIARAEMAAAAVGCGVAILAAHLGGGTLALVWGALANSITKNLLFGLSASGRWVPRLKYRTSDLPEYLRFGLFQTGQRALNFVTANIDFLLIGAFLGAHALGIYSLAFNLVTLVSSKISSVVNRVLFPVLSQVQQDIERVKRGFLKLQQTTSMLSFPVLLGTFAVAPVAVPLFFGGKWQESIHILQILTVVGLGRAIAGTVGPLLLVFGRTDLGFRWSVMVVVLQAPAIYAGLNLGGVEGVAIAFASMVCVFVVLNYSVLIRNLLRISLNEYVTQIWPFLSMSLAMAALVMGASHTTNNLTLTTQFAVLVTVGASSFIAMLWYFQRGLALEILRLFATQKQS
ncbi:MAG: MOP flippase family protein [Burkholderiales bacterium]